MRARLPRIQISNATHQERVERVATEPRLPRGIDITSFPSDRDTYAEIRQNLFIGHLDVELAATLDAAFNYEGSGIENNNTGTSPWYRLAAIQGGPYVNITFITDLIEHFGESHTVRIWDIFFRGGQSNSESPVIAAGPIAHLHELVAPPVRSKPPVPIDRAVFHAYPMVQQQLDAIQELSLPAGPITINGSDRS